MDKSSREQKGRLFNCKDSDISFNSVILPATLGKRVSEIFFNTFSLHCLHESKSKSTKSPRQNRLICFMFMEKLYVLCLWKNCDYGTRKKAWFSVCQLWMLWRIDKLVDGSSCRCINKAYVMFYSVSFFACGINFGFLHKRHSGRRVHNPRLLHIMKCSSQCRYCIIQLHHSTYRFACQETISHEYINKYVHVSPTFFVR